MATTDPDCIFCKIASGEIGARVVHRDKHAIAFLDMAPWHEGHTVVVPRHHVKDVLDEPTALAEIAPAVSATAKLLVDRLGADGINVLSNAGEVAGQTVFHLHVHLVPRYAAEPGIGALVQQRDPGDLDAVLARLTNGKL